MLHDLVPIYFSISPTHSFIYFLSINWKFSRIILFIGFYSIFPWLKWKVCAVKNFNFLAPCLKSNPWESAWHTQYSLPVDCSPSYESIHGFYQKVWEQLTEWLLIEKGQEKFTQVLNATGKAKCHGGLYTHEVCNSSRLLNTGMPAMDLGGENSGND